MNQELFEVFGCGEICKKPEDLKQYSEILRECDMIVPGGMIISTSLFDRISLSFDGLEVVSTEEIEQKGCPLVLEDYEEILDKMKVGAPYAIRSAALSERGGTGIYKSEFFWPTGNKEEDLKKLWHCECVVYASEFTKDAKCWREKAQASMGMAILIQEVVGYHLLDKYFLPTMAGTAYTSYQGLTTVRVVLGLGTKAVNGEGKVYNAPIDDIVDFQRDMWDQEQADVLTPDGICQIPTKFGEIHDELGYSFQTFNKLFECLAKLKKHGDLYLEWAIYRDTIYVVQCSPYEDKLVGDISFDSSEYFTLIQGSDVLHSGRATCKSVVYISGWSARTAHLLEMLNENMKGHLLIVPQESTSMLANNGGYDGSCGLRNKQLSFAHFSNALAVVEEQVHYSDETRLAVLKAGISLVDHSQNLGVSHFSQLCGLVEILFIGAEFDVDPLLALPGMIKYRENPHILIWNTKAEVVVDVSKKSGIVYVSKKSVARKNEFPQHMLQGWADDLRMVANRVNHSGNHEMVCHFYNLSYAIGTDVEPTEYNEFELDKDYLALKNSGGIKGIKESLRVVLNSGHEYVDLDIWEDGLKDYLEKLLEYLSHSDEIVTQ